jgi:glycosyltransferase involved in cell wall biosynthesis
MLLRGSAVHDDCISGSSLRCGLRNPRGNRLESLIYGLALEFQRRVKMLQRWVDAFVAPSSFMARMLVRAGLPQERVVVIPYGVQVNGPSVRMGRGYALFVGRLSQEKGVRTLLESARLKPEIPIVIAGTGPLASEARDAGNSVRYVGSLEPPGVSQALKYAAFTIAPSEWYENCPMSVLESFAAGRAVIATRVGGLPELINPGVNGLLVEPNNAGGLASAIATLWDDVNCAGEMGQRARDIAIERFALERQTAALIDLYSTLQSNQGRRGSKTLEAA